MRPDLGTVPIPAQAGPVGDVVRIVVNHESSVTDVARRWGIATTAAMRLQVRLATTFLPHDNPHENNVI
jgi:hypothetical protein